MATADTQAPSSDTPLTADEEKAQKLASKWISEVALAEANQKPWVTKCEKIRKRYMKQEKIAGSDKGYAMLWSNVQTILPASYAQPATPVVTRRFKDADPVAREATEILERALLWHADQDDVDASMRLANLDVTLCSRGQVWIRYVPTYGEEVTPRIPALQISNDPCTYEDEDGNAYVDDGKIDLGAAPLEGQEGKFEVNGEAYQPITYEQVAVDFVHLKDFGHGTARSWDEVPFVYRKAYLDRDALVKRFGEKIGKAVPLDWSPPKSTTKAALTDQSKKACVYEVWDKASKTAIWISSGYSASVLDQRPDPLKLPGFFPCPKPIYGTLSNEDLYPTPDYLQYQDQAEEVDILTNRITELQKGLKVVGLYAGESKSQIANLMGSSNGTMVPVPAWEKFKESGGARGQVEWWPIEQVVQALTACIQLRKQLIEDIFQITGVSDILRGASDPRETAAAQGIKAHWGAVRIRNRQKDLARFARDICRLQGQVIAEHFAQETLAKMTNVKLLTNAEKAQITQAQQLFQQQQAIFQQGQQAAQAQMMGHNGGPPMDPAAQGAPGAPPGPPSAPQVPPQAAAPPPGPPQAPPGPMAGPVPGPQPVVAPPQPPQLPPGVTLENVEELMSKPSWEDVMALLKDESNLSFRIDIETDSTIEADETEAKQETVELMNALGTFIQQWGPVVTAAPQMAPVVAELLKFALRRFRAGRSIEDIVEQALDAMLKNPPQPPAEAAAAPTGPSPQELQIKAAQVQVDDKRADNEAMEAQAKAANDAAKTDIERGNLSVKQGDLSIKAFVASKDPKPQVNA